jgi:DNA-binding NarL/FixJ family response regulator
LRRLAPDGEGARILIIDDEPFIRWMVRQLLLDLGASQIYEAADGTIGLKETLRLRPDAVLCDIHMPGEDGLAFLAALRATAITAVARTPVIMLTSDKTTGSVVAAKRLKADGYLVKPLSIGSLKKALERVLAPPSEV